MNKMILPWAAHKREFGITFMEGMSEVYVWTDGEDWVMRIPL